MRILLLGLLVVACSCSSTAPQTAPREKPKPSSAAPAPKGPTRTDFKTIAQKLVGRCVAGGWISAWRAEQKDIDVARPRVYLSDFEDQTGNNLDPSYLNTELGNRLRLAKVFELTTEEGPYDFIGKGKLLRLAERTKSGERMSVYTAVLELLDPKTKKVVHSCESTVQGEM